MSKKKTMRRWSRSCSGVATFDEVLPRTSGVARPLMVASFRGEAWSTLSKSKLAIRCGLPFSRIVKSPAVRPRTTAPVFLSRTTTLVSTRSVLTLRTKSPASGRGGASWPRAMAESARMRAIANPGLKIETWGTRRRCIGREARASRPVAGERRRRWKRFVILGSETIAGLHCQLAHAAGGDHLPQGKGVVLSVDAGILHDVERIGRGSAELQAAGAAEVDSLGQRHIDIDGAGAGDGVARGRPVLLAGGEIGGKGAGVEPVVARA